MARLPLWQRTVTYGAVGGTKALDLLRYPPAGFRPFEQRSRIGHGDARWEYAWQQTLSWGIQRNSGLTVKRKDSPTAVTENTYIPVVFDETGAPVAPEAPDEVVYDAAGVPFVAPGDTAMIVAHLWVFGIPAPCRVIYVIDEQNRKGFAYGTLPGHPESGEEAFIVDRTEDGSVWLTVRSLSRPSTWFWWMTYPVLRVVQKSITRRYFRSLSEPLF